MGFEVCGPNEVMVVSGCCLGRSRFIPGGRIFVWPGIQRLQRMCLNTLTLLIESPQVYTKQGVAISVTGIAQLGVAISVTGIAQVKIQGSNQDMLQSACELFLGKTERQIRNVAQETLEGHQRAIMGNMTVEEIYKDRKKFSKAVFEVASSDLVNMGIYVVSYTIKDIRDEEGYLKSLGMKRTSEVQRDARIGEAEAQRDAGIKEALAEEKRMQSRYLNDIEISKAQRDFELKKAAYDMEVQTTKAQADLAYDLQVQTTTAQADLAYDLQAAKTKQRIKEETMQVTVIERGQAIQVQEQEIIRRERELDARVRKPAEAEKFRLEKIAEANKLRVILEAEAEAEAIQVKGEAEAYAIEAKARAEAEQMAKKADAWKDYQDAAMVDMVLETLPKVAAEIAQPLTNTRKITMVSSGKGDVGALKLTGEVMSIMQKLPTVIENLTGINIANSMKAQQRK
ncbi:flocculin flo1 [Nucella lapillus]